MQEPRILAITLARGGSKSIPSKNLALINSKPLIQYTFDIVPQIPNVRYIVSTDSHLIRDYSLSAGIDVPFLRPPHLATDTATSVSALQHAVAFCEAQDSVKYDIVVELMATNPFKTAEDCTNCINLLIEKSCDSVIGVTQLHDHHPARIKKLVNGYIHDFCVPELSSRRQDLSPPAYIRNGSIYALNRDKLMDHNHRFGGPNSFAYIMPPERSINIDEPTDLIVAEALISS